MRFNLVYFLLCLIFLLAIIIRFIYFPDNIYFSYDQARDSFTSLEILKGDLKIIGPSSSYNDNFFHGPLVYYIYAPIYFISHNNPEAISIFLRILNATGIFLVFFLGTIIFNKKVGLLSALFFALSYEQSQYALFFGHPALAVIPVLSFYLGLGLIIFRNNSKGLILALFSLGIATQFHYVNILLSIVLLILLVIFRKEVKIISFKYWLLSIMAFLLAVSSFILAEIKYNFRVISELLKPSINLISTSSFNFNHLENIIIRSLQDNFGLGVSFTPFLLLILVLICVINFNNKKFHREILFLMIWFLGGLLPYFIFDSPTYYLNPAASVSLLIFGSFVIIDCLSKYKLLQILIIIAIVFLNFKMIISLNIIGPNGDFVIQQGMLLSDEKKVLDYIYLNSSGKQFSVKSLSVPLSVNTTWSYLFEWYGKEKYNYLPIWTGPIAQGFSGNLEVINIRSKLPQQQFLIIEPTQGIREGYKEDFMREESYFTKITDEIKIGNFIVQKRQKF